MKFWKPEGPGRFRLGEWLVIKDWATGLWDLYRGGTLVETNFGDAPAAMKRAEELGA